MDEQLTMFRDRFEATPDRHDGLSYDEVETRLTSSKRAALVWMEQTGGEPNVVKLEGRLVITDTVKESPIGRRSVCFDEAARLSRKKNAPVASIESLIETFDLHLLTPEQYQELQTQFSFDEKTSSWLATPDMIHQKGGALFGDRRYETTFVYHNGADSYYASRGFRVFLELD
ncbi:hypothetical protein ADM98_10315 [Exiguobacterium sp. BMC-KP]|uniref:DUF4256 domain-containing protein n=1 Tax=Exiguobacterium sp. BMC-KP TaxID=1684312 RepID=UPI0006AA0CCD|nr:DUF4256 domain-containing protein [Exiguobacterium sp. BMC-KP]KOP29276.1 hypothetical protein ADM98_10315 [Exiguobacterium sp. BMC-KP]